MTDNAAKAKCPVWGKGSKWKMNIGASWCVDHDEVEVEVWSLLSRKYIAVRKLNSISFTLQK